MDQLANYWAVLAPFLSMLAGGFVTWTTVRVKLETLIMNHQELKSRVDSLEKARETDRVMLADRLARMEVKLDALHIKLESK